MHQPLVVAAAGFPRVDKVLNRINVILPAAVGEVVIAAANRAVVDIARSVNRLDVVIAAAHSRASDFARAIGEVCADDYVIVTCVIVEVMARSPGEARPAAAVVAVLDFNDVGFALKALKPGFGSGVAVVPICDDTVHRARVVKALDFVDSRRFSRNGNRLTYGVSSALVHNFVIDDVVACRVRGERLVVRERDGYSAVGNRFRGFNRFHGCAARDKLGSGHGDCRADDCSTRKRLCPEIGKRFHFYFQSA